MTRLVAPPPPQRSEPDSSTGSLWQRWTRGVRKLWQRPDWAVFAGRNWPAQILDAPVTDDFHAKQGRSTGRLILEHAGRHLAVYLKRHYRLRWWRGLLAALWPSRNWAPALQEMRHLRWAAAEGLPVPEVVAAGEFIGPHGKLQSVLVIEELTGMLPLHEAIPQAARSLSPAEFARWKRGMAVELARLARFLHDRRRFHKDLYLCHFFIPQADTERVPQSWSGLVHMIDFHRLGWHRWTWPIWRIKDLGQLLYSSRIDSIGPRDRLRFWRHYLGTGKRRQRFLTWCVRAKGDLYKNHNAKRSK